MLVQHIGGSRLVVQSDCMEVVEIMMNDGFTVNSAAAVYDECKIVWGGFQEVAIEHTSKEANQVAYELAKQAMFLKENCIWDDDPLVLLFLLANDVTILNWQRLIRSRLFFYNRTAAPHPHATHPDPPPCARAPQPILLVLSFSFHPHVHTARERRRPLHQPPSCQSPTRTTAAAVVRISDEVHVSPPSLSRGAQRPSFPPPSCWRPRRPPPPAEAPPPPSHRRH
jgi:hypothetical protein